MCHCVVDDDNATYQIGDNEPVDMTWEVDQNQVATLLNIIKEKKSSNLGKNLYTFRRTPGCAL